ncbi:hypothetical protein ANRL1_01446 [Anaerolineae bacterium]|nr:hypothetical protein ANRL1_01446 [Anaerolineae bacterium]
MNRFTSAIRTGIQTENLYAALFLALTMPDICSKLEHAESGSSGPRYRAWFERYLLPNYTMSIMGHKTVFMTSGDCWALRCSLFHEGSDDMGEQKAKETVSRFRFTTRDCHLIKINDVLVLNIARFCEEVCKAVEAWASDVTAVAAVQERIRSAVSVAEESFLPSPGVRIG